jgi:predicted amidohydrolase YtcJ
VLTAVSDPPLDVAILGARVHAAPGEPATGNAIGVRDGRVVTVGAAADVRARIGSVTRVVEAGDRTILPAFTDSHTHFHRGAVLRRFYLDFEDLRPASVADVVAAVEERARILADGEWVQGDGLSAPRLAEGRLPNRRELDGVSLGHPVVLRGIGKHVVAANSAALAAAGIDAATQDPPGGRIEREADGEPNGILHERAKLRLDQSDPSTPVPKPSAAERQAALRAGFALLHEKGIATIHEMVRLPEEADDYHAVRAAGGLRVRVRFYYRVHESPIPLDALVKLGIRRGFGDDWLRILGVKISVDGFCIFRNAAVHEPYLGEPDNLGLLRIEPEALRDLVARANAQGLNVAVHAVGARAVDHALDAFEAAGPPVAGPHRLEHGYIDVDADRLRRAAALGLAWSVQPGFLAAYGREWQDAFGRERVGRIMPLADGVDAGLPILFNSDFPCVPIDPLGGIRAAVSARSVDLVTAWRAFTTTPAELAGEPAGGRLEVGAPADLIVLDEDPFAASADLGRVSVRATMVAGDLVHGTEDLGG